jgi:LysR family glycine cleavage system transcriptional activator
MSTSRRLAPLNALKAFEAAGRHLSFTAAADELCVTLSAVSHQIRQLEEHLGVPLFHRTRKGLVLSAEGQLILPDLREGFDRIGAALARLDTRREEGVLTVSMLSTFAMRWFIPRLARFQEKHPAIEVRISTSVNWIDLEREGVDCAIRFGRGDWSGLACHKLFDEVLQPVCTPALAAQLSRPQDLAEARLLHAQLRREDWKLWLTAAGLDGIDASKGPVFETRAFVIQAALQGLGIACLDPALVADEVAAGRLVRPFDLKIPIEGAYWFVCPDHLATAPRLTVFRDWLLAEAAGPPAEAPTPAIPPA